MTHPTNLDWQGRGVVRLSQPEKSTYNPSMEEFNRRFRQECLNENWLLSLADAEEKVES